MNKTINKSTNKSLHLTFVGLIILLLLSIVASFLSLGNWGVVLALFISFLKATLIAFIFMDIGKSTRLVQIFSIGGVFWLGILIFLSLSDYVSRGFFNVPGK